MSKEIWAYQYPIGQRMKDTSWSMAQPTAHHHKYHAAPPWAASQSTSARSTPLSPYSRLISHAPYGPRCPAL
jgi:hypothetical protein